MGCGVGRAGLDPGHLLCLPTALPASTGVPDPLQAAPICPPQASRWLPQHQLPGAAVPVGGPQGQGLGRGLSKCSEVSRCYQGGRGQSCWSQSTRPSPAVPALSPTLRGGGYVCPSCSRKAMPGLLLSSPRSHNLPMASVQHPCPSGPLRRWPGACGIVRERSLHSQAPCRGRVLGESLPVPHACLHEASTNRSPFFVVVI
ncbi:unnamed protein product [Pipistrellus nathusii]|uniref:Uncharacterized protein n=1 Tax=Pipistrellus nathusii TaxID=59473 RepID=A0ABN9ZBU4_PIPNA